MAVTTTAQQAVEESAIPAPPPPPVPEEAGDDFNPSRGRILYKVWDKVLIYGPISETDLYPKIQFQTGGSWRKYLRMHPEAGAGAAEHDPTLGEKANRWYFEQEIAFGLKNGYLKREGDDLVIGTCPPEHEPLQTVGGDDGVRKVLEKDKNASALDILRNKTNPARRKPIPYKVAALRKSLATPGVGQLDAVRMWQPPNVGADPIIINGQTRLGVMEKMGWSFDHEDPAKRIKREWLPEGTSATEALLQRIHHELHASTKDQSKEAEEAYVEQLHAAGVSQADIAKEIGLTQQRVNQILAKKGKVKKRTEPSKAEIRQWHEMHEAGWPYRDIAEFSTGYGKDTIRRHVVKFAEDMASDPSEVTEEIQREEDEAILEEAFGENQGTSPEAKDDPPETKHKRAKRAKPRNDAAKKHGAPAKSVNKISRTSPETLAAVFEAAMKSDSPEDRDLIVACCEALKEHYGNVSLDRVISVAKGGK